MESWQKELILKNRDRLITNTVCSTLFLNIFLSKEILSAEDLQKIGVEERTGGQFQAAGKFYDAIVTRNNAFVILLKALKETRQSGAHSVLSESLEDQLPSTSTSQNALVTQQNPHDLENALRDRITTNIFNESPAYLTQFLTSKHKSILVVLSEDCNITCNRLIETTDIGKIFYELGEFVEYLSIHAVPLYQIPVYCGKNLEQCIRLLCGIKQKCILVTSQLVFDNHDFDDDDIQKKLNKGPLTFAKDNITWNDLTVTFRLKLCTNLGNDPRINLSGNDISKALEDTNYSSFVELINEKPLTLFKSSIPPPILNYIPRSLLARKVVDRQIFTTNSDNIFVFQGIRINVLRTHSNRQDVVNSTSVIEQGYQLFSQFVILDDDDHYKRMCKNTQHKSFHLLGFDGNDFIWKNTHGSIESIQYCLSNTQPSSTEKTFFEDLLGNEQTNNIPICISDTPGMGKTVFLANVARKMQQKVINGVVGYVVISELIRDIRDAMDKLQTEQITEQITEEMIVSVITTYLSTNSIGALCLVINKCYMKELFLDGFDEIDHGNEKLGYELLLYLRRLFPKTRLWTTTRPHMLLKLEEVLQVLGFNMLPFGEDDQINFLTTFWGDCLPPNLNSEKLGPFAKHCLDNVKSILDAKEQDIAGIPLQCLMIAEVFEDEAFEFCKSSDGLKTQKLAIHHIVQLYEGLVEKKIKIFFSRYGASSLSAEKLSSGIWFLEKILPKLLTELLIRPILRPLSSKDLINVHVYESLCLFYPKLATRFKTNLVSRNLSAKQIVDCGLLELKNTELPKFVHRTIAEYFLAILFIDSLNGKYNRSLRNLVFEEIFQVQQTEIRLPDQFTISCFEFQNYVVCYFIDALLVKNPLHPNLGYELIFSATADTKRKLSKACASGNFQNIFHFLFSQKSALKNISDEEFLLELLCIAVYRGCLVMLNVCKNLNVFNLLVDLNKFRNRNYTLLHFAVFGGDYRTVKHLCENENFNSEIIEDHKTFSELVPLCVVNTKNLNDKLLKERIQIFDYILNINKDLIICVNSFGQGSFLRKDIHTKFVNEIIAKILKDQITTQCFLHDLTKNRNGNTFLEIIFTLFPDKENHDFCSLLTSKLKKVSLLQTIVQNIRPNDDLFDFLSLVDFGNTLLGILQIAVRANDKKWVNWILKTSKPSCLEIVESLKYSFWHFGTNTALSIFDNVDPKSKSCQGNNLLHTLIIHLYAMKEYPTVLDFIVNFFLEKGVDATSVNENGSTPLHVLAERSHLFYSKAVYKYLIDYGAGTNAQDAHGNTPLCIILNSCTQEYFDNLTPSSVLVLLENGADINIENNKKETPMLIAVAKFKWCKMIQTFITNGNPDFNKTFYNGNTYLHLLFSHVYDKDKSKEAYVTSKLILEFLVNKFKLMQSFNPLRIPNDDGKTPLDLANLVLGVSEVKRLLFQHTLDITTTENLMK